jgi:hypothetical protein
MDMVIHKQVIMGGNKMVLGNQIAIKLPKNSTILYVGPQPPNPVCIWYAVPNESAKDPELQETDNYIFKVVGTGQHLEDSENWYYQDTVCLFPGMMIDGGFSGGVALEPHANIVYHVFRRRK